MNTAKELVPYGRPYPFMSDDEVQTQSGTYKTVDSLPQRHDLEIIRLHQNTKIIDPDAVYTEAYIWKDPDYPQDGWIHHIDPLMHVTFHFLSHVMKDRPGVKILDLGGNPIFLALQNEIRKKDASGMGLAINESWILHQKELQYPFAALMSLHPKVTALSVDITPPPENTRWLNAGYLTGNFLDRSVQERTMELLGGRPDIVVCSVVLINNLVTEWFQRDMYGNPQPDGLPAELHPRTLVNNLAKAAFSLAAPDGYILVHNGYSKKNHCHGDTFLPKYVRDRIDQLSHFYIRGVTRVYKAHRGQS